jgi:pimeloyl-ACP methyl ester carboxylesterase
VPLVEEAPPYYVEDVVFESGEVTLSGTFTRPDSPGQHPAVVLMTGTGPQTRDELVVPGFPIFKLIADHLTRQGIAVLRYDDRGVGQSGGDYDSTSIYDFAADGQAAVDYLKTRSDVDPEQVGLLGHSEGGIYAAIIGGSSDSGVAFIISLAGTAALGSDLLNRQNELILASAGADEAIISEQLAYLEALYPLIAERDWQAVRQHSYERYVALWDSLSTEERASTGSADAEAFAERSADSFLNGYGNESFATLLEYDPAVDWAKTTVPVLAVFGELDLQVDPQQNAAPMTEALTAAGNEDFQVVVLEGANHLFQAAQTGALDEYITLPAQFTDEFLPLIAGWLLERVDTAAG